jgi:quercetin dioxygenase-like cupin family protein
MELPQCSGNVFGIAHAGVFPSHQHPLRYLNKLLLSVGGKVKLGEAGEEILGQLLLSI